MNEGSMLRYRCVWPLDSNTIYNVVTVIEVSTRYYVTSRAGLHRGSRDEAVLYKI